MTHRVRVLAVILALSVLATAATASAVSVSSHRYLDHVSPRITAYRAVLKRLDDILSETPIVNVDPKVEKLNRIADSFEVLAARWHAIEPPKGLKVRHRGMGRVFELHAQGWRIYAAALFTRHLEEMQIATKRLGARLRSAAYLQKRWAAALRGALVRAGTPVPKWLHRMVASAL